jgi:hypothetical protein
MALGPLLGFAPLQFYKAIRIETVKEITAVLSFSERSALGHKGDILSANGNVRFTPKADVCGATRDVRFGPKADSCTAAKYISIRSPHRRGRATMAAR